jgi:hypothetical protein
LTGEDAARKMKKDTEAKQQFALWLVKRMNASKVREEYLNAREKYKGPGTHLLSTSVRHKIDSMYEKFSWKRGWSWSWMKDGLFLYNIMNSHHAYGLAKKSVSIEVFGNISRYIHNAIDRETYRKENGLWYDKKLLDQAKKEEEEKKKLEQEQSKPQQIIVIDDEEDDDVVVKGSDDDGEMMMEEGSDDDDDDDLREKKARLDDEIARCLQMQEEKEEMEDGDYEP